MDDDASSELVVIARAVKPRGLKGEIVAELLTDFPERFEDVDELVLVSPRGETSTSSSTSSKRSGKSVKSSATISPLRPRGLTARAMTTSSLDASSIGVTQQFPAGNAGSFSCRRCEPKSARRESFCPACR